jgi:hypothetical protein
MEFLDKSHRFLAFSTWLHTAMWLYLIKPNNMFCKFQVKFKFVNVGKSTEKIFF